MPLSKEQIDKLLGLVKSCKPDCLNCDECFAYIAEFAEVQLTARSVPEALVAVETHLGQCPCCRDEYKALVEGLQAMNHSE